MSIPTSDTSVYHETVFPDGISQSNVYKIVIPYKTEGFEYTEAIQESSVVLINKKQHWDVVDLLYRMNDNHKENFKYAHGDKELWWIAFRKLEKE